jgi:hypothetical protein
MYPHEAYLAKAFLESEGIDSEIRDELTVQVNNFYSNAIGGVKLLVRESDYEKGIEALKKGGYIDHSIKETITIEMVEFNRSSNLKTCPFCHSSNISIRKTPNILTVLVIFILNIVLPIQKRTFVCHDCGKEWKYKKSEK